MEEPKTNVPSKKITEAAHIDFFSDLLPLLKLRYGQDLSRDVKAPPALSDKQLVQ